MQQFIRLFIKGLIIILVISLTFILFARHFTKGYVDSFYKRFTYPAPSLVLGTSRAAQAIQPNLIENKLNGTKVAFPILNYSFTVGDSPFGPYYLESIKKKVSEDLKNGVFIISVDPWALSIGKETEDENAGNFREASEFIGKMHLVNANPNYEYLLFHLNRPYYRLILDNNKEGKREDKLHNNGWLEINIPMDSISMNQRKTGMLTLYRTWFETNRPSDVRFNYLSETIKFLQTKGKVFLVRLPVSEEMMVLEKQYMPSFDNRISEIAKVNAVPYYNYINRTGFLTTDGTHLFKTSGAIISNAIADSILVDLIR